jgi:opacity protein-like surface antigen
MRKGLSSVVCASVLFGSASIAMAGAYGEPVAPEEGPAPVAVAPAVVEEAPNRYPYIGAGALFAIENFHCDADNAWGYNARVGYRINDYVAVELMGEHAADNFDDADKVDGFGRLNGDVSVWNITANAKIYPVRGMFQPYILIGPGYGQADLPHDDNHGFVARFGGGIDILFTDNFGMDVESGYVLGTGAVSDYDYVPISIGFFYNFI